jgi:hypothetical protein
LVGGQDEELGQLADAVVQVRAREADDPAVALGDPEMVGHACQVVEHRRVFRRLDDDRQSRPGRRHTSCIEVGETFGENGQRGRGVGGIPPGGR